MNTRENTLRYLGFGIMLLLLLSRVLHYVDTKDITPMLVISGGMIASAYQRYAQRLQQRCQELEQQLTSCTGSQPLEQPA